MMDGREHDEVERRRAVRGQLHDRSLVVGPTAIPAAWAA